MDRPTKSGDGISGSNREERVAWKERRRLFTEVMSNGEVVTSKGKWFAKDRGNGVVTKGVFNCVGIATPELVAHISADRQIPTDSEFKQFCEALKMEGINSVELFGLPEKLLSDVESELDRNGISYEEHLSEDDSKAFIIIVKDGKISYFLD